VTRIAGAFTIARPIETIFDFVADERNNYDDRLVTAVMLTPEPVGLGTRFRCVTKARGRPVEMIVEIIAYERPRTLGSRTRGPGIKIDSEMRFEDTAAGTRISWAWDVEPSGALRLVSPALGVIARRQADRLWSGLRTAMERSSFPMERHGAAPTRGNGEQSGAGRPQ
jgi:hypothetical protein